MKRDHKMMSLDYSIPKRHCYYQPPRGEAVELPLQTPSPIAELPASDGREAPPRQSIPQPTKISPPCSNNLADKNHFINMDCTHSKLIIFLIVYRWFSTHLEPDQRNECPTCRRPCDSFQLMMIHLIQCPAVKGGMYWCWECNQLEVFQQSRCREIHIPGDTSKPGMLAGFKNAVHRVMGKGLRRSGVDASNQLVGIRGRDTPLHQLHLDVPGRSDLLVNGQIQTFMNAQDNLFGQMYLANDSRILSSANTHNRPNSDLVSPISTVSTGSRPGMQQKRATWPQMAPSHLGPCPSIVETVHLPADEWQPEAFSVSVLQKDNPQLLGHHQCAPQARPASTLGFPLSYPSTVPPAYVPELEGGPYRPAVELAAANVPTPAYPLTGAGSLQGPPTLSRSSKMEKLWEAFSANFGEMSGNPIRGQDPGEVLVSGLDGLQIALSGTGQLIPRMLVGLTHLIAAMAAQVAQDLPAALHSQALSGISNLDPMRPGVTNIEAVTLIAGYYLDALEVESHLDRTDDPCEQCCCGAVSHQQYGNLAEAMAREFPWLAENIRSEVELSKYSSPRHLELSLLNLYISRKLMVPDNFFGSYLHRAQYHIESSYCKCESSQRLTYRLRTLDKMRQELLAPHNTSSPSPDPVPLNRRQSSWGSSTVVDPNVDAGHVTGSPVTLSGGSTPTHFGESTPDVTPNDLACPFGSCGFSSDAAGRVKILRRHVQMEHLPVQQFFVCKHVGSSGTPCDKQYKRKDYVNDHWKKHHTGTVCMDRVMAVRNACDFESDPNRILLLDRGRSLWHLGPYWDVV